MDETEIWQPAASRKEAGGILGNYWTLSQYDDLIAEAKDEKAFMKAAIRIGDMLSAETLMGEAVKLLE